MLFHAGVVPILDNCSGVWGYERLDKINTVNLLLFGYRYISFPNLAINGDMGLVSSRTTQGVEMGR